MSTDEIVLDHLEEIAETDQVRKDLDLELFDEAVLDSLGMVELIVALDEAFQLNLSPAQVDREMWSTPRKIIADVQSRLAARQPGAE